MASVEKLGEKQGSGLRDWGFGLVEAIMEINQRRDYIVVTCGKCGGNGPEPEKRIAKVKLPDGCSKPFNFTCRFCTAAMSGSGQVREEFWRRPVSLPVYARPTTRAEQNFLARQRHIGEPFNMPKSKLSAARHLKQNLSLKFITEILPGRASSIAAAKKLKLPWALAATAENLVRLPKRRLVTLLLVEFFGLRQCEAAVEMEVGRDTVSLLLKLAKRDLEAMHKNKFKTSQFGPKRLC